MRGCPRLWVVNTSDDDEATDDMFAFYSIDNGAFSETVTLFFPSNCTHILLNAKNQINRI